MNGYATAALVGALLVALAFLIVTAVDAWDDFARAQDDLPDASNDDGEPLPCPYECRPLTGEDAA